MRRREFIAMLGGSAGWPFVSRAQQPGEKVRRIGYLAPGSPSLPASSQLRAAFQRGLAEHGWIEGRNLVIDYRLAEGRFERLPDLAAELVQLKVDVIVAGPTTPALAAKNATETIPIVMVNVGDPVRLGLVESLARPGGNVTGLAYSVGLELMGKGLELLKEIVPRARRVAILSNPTNPSHPLAVRDMMSAARALGIELQSLETRSPDEFDGAFAAMAQARAEALLVVPEAVFTLNQAHLLDLVAKHRLPSMYGDRRNAEAGGLISYAPSFPEQWRQAAAFVDKILKGATPGELPVRQPTQFELVINLRAAKALGVEIPASLLARADEVIE
ncbi:MAG TPA: ABC transporter substrate-binding protein [Methyloceanibacter sp.]|nr:ABC transporter substrate-binding protein [Methyloceanibacter sp.]